MVECGMATGPLFALLRVPAIIFATSLQRQRPNSAFAAAALHVRVLPLLRRRPPVPVPLVPLLLLLDAPPSPSFADAFSRLASSRRGGGGDDESTTTLAPESREAPGAEEEWASGAALRPLGMR